MEDLLDGKEDIKIKSRQYTGDFESGSVVCRFHLANIKYSYNFPQYEHSHKSLIAPISIRQTIVTPEETKSNVLSLKV